MAHAAANAKDVWHSEASTAAPSRQSVDAGDVVGSALSFVGSLLRSEGSVASTAAHTQSCIDSSYGMQDLARLQVLMERARSQETPGCSRGH